MSREAVMNKLTLVLTVLVLSLGGTSCVANGNGAHKAELRGRYDLDELYSYPIKWGMAPSSVAWSPDGSKIAFLWNSEGGRFRDIYFASIPEGEVSRATEMRVLPLDARQSEGKTEEELQEVAHYDPGVTSFTWSQDESRLAFTYRGDVFVVPSSGGNAFRRVVESAATESGLRFSPDSRRLGFVRNGNIWALDLETGAERQLSELPGIEGRSINSYGWAPGQDFLFFILRDRSNYQKEAMPDFTLDHVLPNLTPFRYRRGDAARAQTQQVGILPGNGGTVRWVNLEAGQGLSSVRWFPDGSKLLVSLTRPGTQEGFLNAVDPKSMELTLLATGEYSASNVLFSPDGEKIIIPSDRDGRLHLYTMATSGGELEQLTDGEWDLQTNINSRRFLDVPSQGDRIFFGSSAVHPLEKHLFWVSVDGGEPERLSPDNRGTYTPYASPDGRYVVVDYSAVEVPHDLYLIDTAAPGEMKRITASPLPEFADVVLIEPKYYTFTNPNDGVTVHYRMLTPPGFDESGRKKYPVVFTHMYADEGKNGWNRYRPFEAFLAAEMNYLVVSLDGRGSSGHGKEFARGRSGGQTLDVEDHLEAGKHMRTLPYVDPHRVGAWGKSYGGDLALMILFQEPGVFDTSVCIQPVTRRPRAIYKPELLQANLLLIDSSLDRTVYFREMALMMQMLIDSGKYADFWLYPKEDHSLALRDETFKDTMKRIAQYFEDHWGPQRTGDPDDPRLGW